MIKSRSRSHAIARGSARKGRVALFPMTGWGDSG